METTVTLPEGDDEHQFKGFAALDLAKLKELTKGWLPLTSSPWDDGLDLHLLSNPHPLQSEAIEKMGDLARARLRTLQKYDRHPEKSKSRHLMLLYQDLAERIECASAPPMVDKDLALAVIRLCEFLSEGLKMSLAASGLRTKATPEAVAEFAKLSGYEAKSKEHFAGEAAKHFNVSESTILRRIRDAERRGLLPMRRAVPPGGQDKSPSSRTTKRS